MAVELYMDVHVPSAITEGLRRRDVNVITSQEDGTREADDDALLLRADELGRVVVSQDTDLLRIAHDWQQNSRAFAGPIFAHQENMSIGRITSDLELIAMCCEPEELRDRVIYLPLR